MFPPFMYLGQSSASFLHDWKTSLDSKLEKNWRGIGWETEDFVTLFSDWPPLLNISCSLTWYFSFSVFCLCYCIFFLCLFPCLSVSLLVCFFVCQTKIEIGFLPSLNILCSLTWSFSCSFLLSPSVPFCFFVCQTKIEIGFLPSLNISGPIAILQLTPSLLFRLGEYVFVKSWQLALFF